MTGSGVESPSHWISRESGSTPLGRLTLQLSVYEVPATPDPSPDTTTTGGATGATNGKEKLYIHINILNIPGSTGPATSLGRYARTLSPCLIATREMLCIPPAGRLLS